MHVLPLCSGPPSRIGSSAPPQVFGYIILFSYMSHKSETVCRSSTLSFVEVMELLRLGSRVFFSRSQQYRSKRNRRPKQGQGGIFYEIHLNEQQSKRRLYLANLVAVTALDFSCSL